MRKYNRCCDNCKYRYDTSYEYKDSECLIFGEETPDVFTSDKYINGCCLHHKELQKLDELLNLSSLSKLEKYIKYYNYMESLEEKYRS